MKQRFALLISLATIAMPLPANATSIFAREYGLSCDRCHTVVPLLNTFGENFKSNGYRISGLRQTPAIPLSTSVLTTYQSSGDEGHAHAGVNEWRLQSGGALGSAVTYYIEDYVIDGGSPGALDQAWIQYDSNTAHPTAKTDIRLRAGKMYLPLPVYADTYRPTLTPYPLFEQSVGSNSFVLDTEEAALDAAAGNDYDGLSAHVTVSASNVAVIAGHHSGAVDFSAYHVQGSSRIGASNDGFWRQGLVAAVKYRRLTWTTVVQNGYDANADGLGGSRSSGGAFSQLQWTAGKRTMAVARVERTSQSGASQTSLTAAVLFGLTDNSRLTIEDHVMDGKHAFLSGLLLAL
jgi:hypothetical protein